VFVCLGKIQALKHSVPKGDKKKKKEMTLEIAKLETEIEERHQKEIQEFQDGNKTEVNHTILGITSLIYSFQ